MLRDLGPRLAAGVLAWSAVVALLAAAMYSFFGRDGAFFVAGAGTGAFVVMSMVTSQLLDPVGARLYSGLEGETSTANELHKLHRAG